MQALQYHCCFKFKDITPTDTGDTSEEKKNKKGGLLKNGKIGMGSTSNIVGKTSKYNI